MKNDGGNESSIPGLVDFGYRFYVAEIGRWLTRDPIGVEGGVNLYVYVANNPINVIDPLGLYGTESCEYWSIVCADNGGWYECNLAKSLCPLVERTRNKS
ncbi:MAG: RHS repeat-associated core domain-containing protein [Pseudomonadota bacterium]